MNWIEKCLDLYEEFLKRVSHSDERPEPHRLEQALADAKQVGSDELRVIEESPHWPYPQWWPRLSAEIGEPPVPLPIARGSLAPAEKEVLVESLLGRLKYPEVVSIVLRFIFPKEFGIMSPPVIGLLNLGPRTDNTQQYYLPHRAQNDPGPLRIGTHRGR